MRTIHLTHTWRIDDSRCLGRGGFGAVYVGYGEQEEEVAVKELFLGTGKFERELEISGFLSGHGHPHVIPILDVGFDPGPERHYIVMALAQRSLQDLIQSTGPLPETDALEMIDAIAAGLDEIRDLVHRDLKPNNVLLHNGVWKLADLGLARFVEESTSLQTMKDCLTPAYAAPEQWRMEHATKATDIYALGCTIYALLQGSPPFPGPTPEDLQQQHLFSRPPPLKASPALRNLSASCLSKAPGSRPSLANVRQQIERARQAGGAAANPLGQAAAVLAEKRITREAKEAHQRKVEEDRSAAAAEAIENVKQILTGLVESVVAQAPQAVSRPDGTGVKLGSGEIFWSIEYPYLSQRPFADLPWDVLSVCVATVQLVYFGPDVRGRSANFIFGKLAADDGYRWWEVAFNFAPGFSSEHQNHFPFGFYNKTDPWKDELNRFFLLSDRYALVTNPRPIDGAETEEFYLRWQTLLAQAALYDVNRVNPFLPIPEWETIDSRFYEDWR